MNHEATHFDRDCLQRLLDDNLPEPQASEVVEHVATCDDCRQRLESLAGDAAWWSRACRGVKAILANPQAYSSSDAEIHAGIAVPAGFSSAAASGDDSHEAFASDFAVDFLEPCDDRALLGRLGEYEILEVIGRGGMGIVLKGFQRELNRYVAVKVLSPHLAQSAAARKRFSREAQATAAIVHPHVMAIHAVSANARLPYLVMPFVACESLQQRLDRHGPLDVQDILRIGLQAAHGLAAAHAQGLVHRDIKPANILLETSVNRVMLTDFGLARAVDDATLTRTGIIAGTPQYMSPEQAGGDAVDHRSDLFSLGSVLYAMCTGRPPFRAETTFGVLRRIRETAPRPIREINTDIPEWLDRIIFKLLSKDAGERFATATETATLLEQCLAHVQQPTTVPLPERIGTWRLLPDPVTGRRRLPKWVASVPLRSVAYVTISLLIGALAGITFAPRKTPPAADNNGSPVPITNSPEVGSRPPPETSVTRANTSGLSATADEAVLPWDASQGELAAVSALLDAAAANSVRELEALSTKSKTATDDTERKEP
ncbi:MAG: protein kinase [Planctomycetes bacterium]|nr:protein kinase [Planctomycetota bacterium]